MMMMMMMQPRPSGRAGLDTAAQHPQSSCTQHHRSERTQDQDQDQDPAPDWDRTHAAGECWCWFDWWKLLSELVWTGLLLFNVILAWFSRNIILFISQSESSVTHTADIIQLLIYCKLSSLTVNKHHSCLFRSSFSQTVNMCKQSLNSKELQSKQRADRQ